jgi:hypothetical protein
MSRSMYSFAVGFVAAMFLWVASLQPVAGQAINPDPEAYNPAGVIGGSFVTGAPLQNFTLIGYPQEQGTLAQAIIKDTSGGYDFLYQWTNSPSTLPPGTYWGLTTNAVFGNQFVPNQANNGGASPGVAFAGSSYAAQLTALGFNLGAAAVVAPYQDTYGAGTFNWNFTAFQFSPGTTSDILVIQTNANAYTAGTATVEDSSVQALPAFAPSAGGVPEPSMLTGLAGLLAMGGLSGLGLVWRRKRVPLNCSGT